MACLRLVLLFGLSLTHNALIVEGGFLKAALGLRIGLSPEEKGWGQPYHHGGGPAVKGQFLSGVQAKHGAQGGHGGGWGGGGGQGGFLRHLKILGVNLYLGGPKHHHNGGGGGGGGHHGGTHYSKGGGGGGGWGGYSSQPQYVPAKHAGGVDYSTNQVQVIGGGSDGRKPQNSYGYATNLIGQMLGTHPSPNHPFGGNPQGTQHNVVYIPAASQYPSHYANEVVNEIKFLNGKGYSPALTMGRHDAPRPPVINGGPSFSPANSQGHFNGGPPRGSPPPSQGISLASLMKGPQWATKQQPRGMSRFLPFFGLRGSSSSSNGPPPPPGHPMHSPYRRPGPPQRSPVQQSPFQGGPDPSFSTINHVKAPNHQQQGPRGFNSRPNSIRDDYRPNPFGGYVENSSPGGSGPIPFVPRHVQHSPHPSSPTYMIQQHHNHPRSKFQNPNYPPQGHHGPSGPPNFPSGHSNAPETHSFPPQHSPQSHESFTPPAFSPIPTSSSEQHSPPSSSSSSSLVSFGDHTHHGYSAEHSPPPPRGSGFASGPQNNPNNYPYISPFNSPFASEKQRHYTQFASSSGSTQNAVEFSPSGQGELNPNGPPGQEGQVQVFNEQSMGGYEPLPGFAYSHTISSPVVSMGMTTKDDPPMMMEDSQPFKQEESSGEGSRNVKRRFATSQEQQQEIYLQQRQQQGTSSQIQSPVASQRKVRNGFLNSNMASSAISNQWSPVSHSEKKPNRAMESKKILSRSSEQNETSTQVSTAVGSSEVTTSSKTSKIPFIRKRKQSSTPSSTEGPTSSTSKP